MRTHTIQLITTVSSHTVSQRSTGLTEPQILRNSPTFAPIIKKLLECRIPAYSPPLVVAQDHVAHMLNPLFALTTHLTLIGTLTHDSPSPQCRTSLHYW